MSDDTPTSSVNGQPDGAPTRSARASGRSPWWRYALVALLALAGGTFLVLEILSYGFDEGFVAFQPDAADFPAAPVTDAHTVLGAGQPVGYPYPWRWSSYGGRCALSSWQSYATVSTGWHTIRHDWVTDGDPKAWVISEQTIGFQRGDQFDEHVQEFRNRLRYCGWAVEDGYSAISMDLDGLPDGAVTFTVDANPELRNDELFANSNPDDYRALGAFIPGPKTGELMNVMWVGWGTEVPTDEFVTAVNRLYDAAHNAPKIDYPDGPTIDYTYEGFDPDRAGIKPIVGPKDGTSNNQLSWEVCQREVPDYDIWDGFESGDSYVYDIGNGSVGLTVSSGRWRKWSEYLKAKDLTAELVLPVCIGTLQPPAILMEPVDVPGLPDGAVVSRWNNHSGEGTTTLVAMLTDEKKQMVMVVAWLSKSGPADQPRFVEVVNRSWDQFQADNP